MLEAPPHGTHVEEGQQTTVLYERVGHLQTIRCGAGFRQKGAIRSQGAKAALTGTHRATRWRPPRSARCGDLRSIVTLLG